nr:MAG TPA: hypothetical protein [Caudoviricetes sp.]
MLPPTPQRLNPKPHQMTTVKSTRTCGPTLARGKTGRKNR